TLSSCSCCSFTCCCSCACCSFTTFSSCCSCRNSKRSLLKPLEPRLVLLLEVGDVAEPSMSCARDACPESRLQCARLQLVGLL
ncbi:hypothetical protein PENTCL1PPCAC_4089, partial [Pristionchus entomophagus]